MGRHGKTALGIVALLMVTATSLQGQRRREYRQYDIRNPRPAAFVGLSFIAADPVGDFGLLVDDGFGAQLEGVFPLTREGALRLRTDLGFLIYGHERDWVCFPRPIGCRLNGDLITDNAIFFMGVGPELALPAGPLQPYVNASAGFSYFWTRSHLDDDFGNDDHFGTTHLDDFVGAVGLGGGIRARVKGGRTPIFVDFGAQYHRNGITEYLREGDIVDNPDGSITIYPNRTEANLVTYRIGIQVGIPRGRGDR